jgi:hypothetical protein
MPDISHFLAQILRPFSRHHPLWVWVPWGFKLQLEDRGNIGYDGMAEVLRRFQAEAAKSPVLTPLFQHTRIIFHKLMSILTVIAPNNLG